MKPSIVWRPPIRRVTLRHQLFVGQRSGVDDALHGVVENLGVVPVVEPPFQFFEVAVQVLDAHPVEGADDGPLEQAPHAFDTVGVDLADNPLVIGMLDGFMAGVVVLDPGIGLQLIGVDRLSPQPEGSERRRHETSSSTKVA